MCLGTGLDLDGSLDTSLTLHTGLESSGTSLEAGLHSGTSLFHTSLELGSTGLHSGTSLFHTGLEFGSTSLHSGTSLLHVSLDVDLRDLNTDLSLDTDLSLNTNLSLSSWLLGNSLENSLAGEAWGET